MVPLSEVVTPTWSLGPLQLSRTNGYPSLSISGDAASGAYDTGEPTPPEGVEPSKLGGAPA